MVLEIAVFRNDTVHLTQTREQFEEFNLFFHLTNNIIVKPF